MNSVFSFSELGSIFEDARADFSANFRAARAVRGLPSGNYRLRIVSCVFSGTPGREHISFRLEVTSGPFCGRRLNHSIYVFSVNPQQRHRELTRLRTLQDASGLGEERLLNTADFVGREFGGGLWRHVCEGELEIDLVGFFRTDFSRPGLPVTPSCSRTTALPAPARSFCRRASRLAVPRGTGQFSGIFASDSVQ